jgi:hypothetical protein
VYRRVLDKCADMRIHPNDFIHISHAHYMDAEGRSLRRDNGLSNDSASTFPGPSSPF